MHYDLVFTWTLRGREPTVLVGNRFFWTPDRVQGGTTVGDAIWTNGWDLMNQHLGNNSDEPKEVDFQFRFPAVGHGAVNTVTDIYWNTGGTQGDDLPGANPLLNTGTRWAAPVWAATEFAGFANLAINQVAVRNMLAGLIVEFPRALIVTPQEWWGQ